MTKSDRVRVEVSDTSRNTSQQKGELLTRLFRESFYQEQPYEQNMGLFIANRIAQSLGGASLSLDTHLDSSGMTVSFEVSIAESGVSEESVCVTAEEEGEECEAEGEPHLAKIPEFVVQDFLRSPRLVRADVLVVDDTPFNRIVMRAILEKEGYIVDEVSDGRKAVDLLNSSRGQKRSFRLIIMDLEMPEMDGIEATTTLLRMRNEVGIAVPPIIGHSAFTSESDVRNCFEAGMVAFIPKPCSRGVVLSKIQQHILVR